MIDTRPKEETAVRALEALSGHAKTRRHRAHPERRFATCSNVGTGSQLVAVCFHDLDGKRTKVVKFRANSGRWTAPTWVPTSDLSKPVKTEKRYRDALSSLEAVR